MIKISAKTVGELRSKTLAPIMECKKALIEANGKLSKAEEILRIKLGKKILNISNRNAKDGVIAIYISEKVGSLVEINCETDFVAKNNEFIKFSKKIAKLITENTPINLDQLNNLKIKNNLLTVDEKCKELISRIGENIKIRRFKLFKTNNNLISYLHDNKIGVIVEYNGDNESAVKDVAMHIAAMKPIALSSDQIPKKIIEKEYSLAVLKAQQLGKSINLNTKIIDNFMQKFFKEVSLLNQIFIKNNKQTIEKMLKLNKITIKSFSIFVLGEDL
ncbi:translation elongation factor Ts [Candidatus Profftella armatura]|jgi:translation elongation factor Ts|uniref:Elongation factor Ts n=1 Tax=Candidatus Profftella armatura TaxID=669502 RepID=S5R1C1_9PROT|nr:translation elongation factor Ts [Candidatus Profftella armatura]AGS07012.1 elongation factor Ts [Candidatus Profftella armatura]ALC96072.1 elongation factor Ts [Candidatus Profftella armatura]QLK13907.1 elongation factor Ts [Candidatus Profftella armatura]